MPVEASVAERQKELRYRARTDLMWLAREILGYEDLVDRVHQPVANHFYQMKPGTPIADLSDEKGMSLYDPRGHFKTTLAIASAVQWLLNYPNIRLFFGAGKLDRASDSLVAVKSHFQHNPKLRRLFPEFCPPPNKDWGTTTEFTLPNRTKVLVDASCVAFSMDSIKAGPHCDVMFIDDAVHADNIRTPELLQNVIDRFIFMRSIVEPYGYIHVIGTPYSDSDLYAWLEDPENGAWIRKFRRPAWVITNPAYVKGTPLSASDVTLLFPERFTFDFLNSIRKQDEFIFNCQYLLTSRKTGACFKRGISASVKRSAQTSPLASPECMTRRAIYSSWMLLLADIRHMLWYRSLLPRRSSGGLGKWASKMQAALNS